MTPALNTVACMDALDFCRELPEASVDLIATDPPYGLTACRWDVKVPLDAMWNAFKRIIKPRGAIVVTASQPFTSELVMSNREMFRYEWIWDKVAVTNVANAQLMPLRTHESVLVFAAYLPLYYPQLTDASSPFGRKSATKSVIIGQLGTNYQTGVGYPKSIVTFMRPNNLTGGGLHPTQKPVALFEYLIKTYTRPGDLVVDPFCGSGTTAVAARNTGRNYIVGDFLQEYVDITNRRLSAPFTPPLFDLDAPAAPKAETLPLWTEAE